MDKSSSTRDRWWTGLGATLAALVAVTMTLVPLAGVASATSATAAKPKISKFAASPKTVTTTDGTVVLSSTVANATTCMLSSTLPVGGLPVTTSCSSGSMSQSVVVPMNSGPTTLTYKFTLSASGSGGTKSKKLSLKVARGAGQPLPTGFTGTYVGPDDSGDFTNGNFTISGSVDPDVSCDGSSCSYAWSAVTGTWMSSPTYGCSTWTADDDSPIQGIGGSGNIQTDPSSSTGYSADFDFSVWAVPCGPESLSVQFVSHMSSSLPFTPGATQSVWTSSGGGTFTFDWSY